MKKVVSLKIRTVAEAKSLYQELAEKFDSQALPIPDMIEWRADAGRLDVEEFEEIASYLRMMGIAVLFTLRTASQGGEANISSEAYYTLLDFAVERLPIQALDIEPDSLPAAMRHPLVIACQEKGIEIIMSKHIYDDIGPEDTMEVLTSLIRKGGDIAKLAFAPSTMESCLATMRSGLDFTRTGLKAALIPMGEAYRQLRYGEEFYGQGGFELQFYCLLEETGPGQKIWR